ncbi:hypothetical protein SteCoe_9816 [Stentor coeruleus]|uniref:EF-hand domain-containing protein n=1 Tax=Stentor coeruleus TaxID=5963 RepID=A0A1R2CH17_9CILI|nr:hypothetical protein SteCoe_9816 [Stentor coeruleus]
MQELIFDVDLENEEKCLEAGKIIINENLSLKNIISKFANRQINVNSANEKEFLLKQVIRFLKGILKHSLSLPRQSLNKSNSEDEVKVEEVKKCFEEREMQTEIEEVNNEELEKKAEKLEKLEKHNKELELINANLSNELQKLKLSIENTEELKSKILQLTQDIADLEPKFMMKAHKRELELNTEVYDNTLNKVSVWQKAAVKIQAAWKGKKTRKAYFSLIKEHAEALKNYGKIPEREFLIKISKVLKAQRLTFEDCFRAADSNTRGLVTNESFIRFISKLNLNINQYQLTRLITILDEDLSGKLESQEFYETLAAYNLLSDKSKAQSYSQKVANKFQNILKDRQLDPTALFNACDKNQDGVISLIELRSLAQSIGMKKREAIALMDILDTDQSGTLKKDEFLRQTSNDMGLFKIENLSSTSAMRPNSLESIIKNIEATGVPLSKAFDIINFPSSGKVQVIYIESIFKKLFPNISIDDIKFVLNAIDITKSGNIYYKDLIEFLHKYSDPTLFSLPQCYGHISTVLSKLNRPLKNILSEKGFSTILDINSFIKLSTSTFAITEQQSIQVFNDISKYTGKVTLEDLERRFRKNDIEKGDESPRSKDQNVVKDVIGFFDKCNLKIDYIFRCADKENDGKVSANEFLLALNKLVPNMNERLLKDFAGVLPLEITMRDLEILLPKSANVQFDQFGMTEDEVYWILIMYGAIGRLGTSPEVIFHDADKNSDGKILIEEFKNAVKKCIPGSLLTYTDICMIFKAFDKDNNGFIDLGEFVRKLAESQKSMFYDKVIEKVAAEKNNYEVFRITVKSLKTDSDFPIPPLPLKHISKKKEYQETFENLASYIQPNIKTHEYLLQFKLRLSSIITARSIMRVFNLTYYQAEEIFRSLDLHNKGITYCFVLCTVLDSYRTQMNLLPMPHNPSADSNNISLIKKCLMACKNNPVFTFLPPLDLPLNWENIQALNLEQHEVFLLKAAFPKSPYYYHLATTLLNCSVGLILCPIEILHNIIQINNIYIQAGEYFERYSIHPSDCLNKSVFIDKMMSIFSISSVEADSLYLKCYGTKKKGFIWDFFTFFDQVMCMYSNGELLHNMGKLPFNGETNLSLIVKEFYSMLAGFLDKPMARYGLNMLGNYTENEFCDAFNGFSVSNQETLTYLSLMKMNKNNKIRCYHLVCVVNSYRTVENPLEVPLNLGFVVESIGLNMNGISFIKVKNYRLSDTLLENDVKNLFPNIEKSIISSFFNFIDFFGRGFVFAHQIATLVDLAYKSKNDIFEFPFCGNSKARENIKKLFSQNSRHLDVYKKDAITYYMSNKIIPEDLIDYPRFLKAFSYELTDTEAKAVFSCIDITKDGKIKTYHYISCVESYCRNTSNLNNSISLSPLQNIYQLVLEIPDSMSTIEYFIDIPYYTLITTSFFNKYLIKNFSLPIDTIEVLINQITQNQKDTFFFYQFLSIIDIYRNCIENQTIKREPIMLPYKHKEKNIQLDLLLTKFSEILDLANRGSCDYFWTKGIDPTEEISIQEFFVSMVDMNKQQCGLIFSEIDIRKVGKVFLYHLLAVIESYRKMTIENFNKPVVAKKNIGKQEVQSLIETPLQEALNKLGRYFAGDNPKKRPLTANEIFSSMDVNNDGSVSMNEFLDCMNLLPLNLTQNQIYLLLKQVDLNNDGFIDYKEFTNFILEYLKKPNLCTLPSVIIEKPQAKEVKGLNKNWKFKENTLEDAVLKIKMYIENNKTSTSAIEIVFGKIDYMKSMIMTHNEMILALDRLRLGLSDKQKEELIMLVDKNKNDEIKYQIFIDFLYRYSFEEVPEDYMKKYEDIIGKLNEIEENAESLKSFVEDDTEQKKDEEEGKDRKKNEKIADSKKDKKKDKGGNVQEDKKKDKSKNKQDKRKEKIEEEKGKEEKVKGKDKEGDANKRKSKIIDEDKGKKKKK